MKTAIAKIGLLALATGIAIALSSFRKAETTKAPAIAASASSDNDSWEEWQKVSSFVYANISKEMQKHDTHKPSKTSMFSRCPSGYQPNYTSDSVKVDRFVYGKLNNYTGCHATYVCSFKVNVNQKVALIKGKDEEEYMAVKDWVKKKYGANQVKG